MISKNRFPRCVMPALLMPLLLAGCATRSPSSPPVAVEPVTLTPLPASVRAIDSAPSAAYLGKAQTWLLKVDKLSSDATPK